ncbi:DNA helicase [Tanacetum coccineum]
MFAMTSFGAGVDELVNKGRGPYVFKIFGQIYHWIDSLCLEHGHHLRFLLLYVYDTKDEVNNRMHHFCGPNACTLNPDIVKGLIHMLDEHKWFGEPFRTARDRCQIGEIPGFKIRLYNMGGVRGYELPTYEALGGIVFESGPRSRTNFDVIIKFRGRPPQRINKLHQSYMSLQFPLLFIFSQPGFYPDITLKPRDGRGRGKIVKMNAYYKYQLHLRVKEFGLIFKSRRLFQQYVVVVFCAIEQNRLDFMRMHQNYFRSDYLSRLYDAVSRGDRDGIAAGSKVMLPSTFTEGPRVFEKKVKDFFRFLKEVKTFGYVSAGPPKLWAKHWQSMRDDIPSKISKATGIPNYHVNTSELQGYILYELETILSGFGKFVTDFGLDTPPQHLLKDLQNKLLMEEKNYKRELLVQDAAHKSFCFGLCVHGGTGKTFLLKTIISSLQSLGKILLAVASSGIASLLLPAGRTAHSRHNTKRPDECTRASIQGETVILSGDFCQTLPEQKRSKAFAKWLIDVGNDEIGEPDEEDDQDSS